MIRGIYTSLSGMIVDEKKQEIISNNMANANTPGYKAKRLNTKSFNEVLLSNRDTVTGSGENILGNVEFGVEIDDVTRNATQGAFKETDVATDFALDGKGYFVLKDLNENKYFSRNGNFQKDISGFLVDANGNRLIGKDESGQEKEIYVGEKSLNVNYSGEVYIDGVFNCNLKVVQFENSRDMVKIGDNLFVTAQEEKDISTGVKQGNLEMSNVNLSDSYANMITAYRSFESNYKVMSKLNETLGKTVNEIGRVK